MNKLRNCSLHKKHTMSYKYVEKKLIINLILLIFISKTVI